MTPRMSGASISVTLHRAFPETLRYLWSVRPSYDLSTRAVFLFMFVGPSMLAARGRPDFAATVLEITLALFFWYFGGVMLNDLCDLEIDRRSHPERPLPSGVLRPSSIGVGAVSFFAIAIGIAVVYKRAPTFLSVMVALTVAHFVWFKKWLRLPGSSAVITSALVSMIVFYASAAASQQKTFLMWMTWAVLFCALLAANVLNGVEDREAESGIVSNLGEVFGERACVLISATFAFVAAVITVVIGLTGTASNLMFFFGIAGLIQAMLNYRRVLGREVLSEIHHGVLAASRLVSTLTIGMALSGLLG
jgi:geranylgeranylglycerol-phosphate geranylgeranyltransferase